MAVVNVVINKRNDYLEDVSFAPYKNNIMLKHQIAEMAILLISMRENGCMGVNTQFHKMLIADMQKNPRKYPVDAKTIVEDINYISKKCLEAWNDNKNNEYDEKHYNNGFSILSPKFYEDICTGEISGVKYVDALITIAKRL